MPAESFDMEALEELLEASTPKEGLRIIQEHPEFLSDQADSLFDLMIKNADKQENEELAQILRDRWSFVKKIKQAVVDQHGGRFLFHADIKQAQAAGERYLQGSGIQAIQALDEAIAAWERILQHNDFANADENFRLKVLHDSAISFIRRYQARGDINDLDRALSGWQKAVSLTPENAPDLPSLLSGLGIGLADRYARSGVLSDLEDSIAAYRKAVSLTPENSPNLPGFLNNLGNGLGKCYVQNGKLSDLEDSIAAYRKAVSLTPEKSPCLPSVLNNLGAGFSNRYERIGDFADLETAIIAYEKAAKIGLDVSIQDSLSSARSWIKQAFTMQSWEGVEKAYEYIYQVRERLLKNHQLREAKEVWLKEFQGVTVQATYAKVKNNKLEESVVTLERGIARLLSESLGLDQIELAHSNAMENYQRYLKKWRQLKQEEFQNELRNENLESALRETRAEMNDSLDILRDIPDYNYTPPSFFDIHMAAGENFVVYIMSTSAGGLALIIQKSFESVLPIVPIWLPEFTEKALNEALFGTEEDRLVGYLGAYLNWRQTPSHDTGARDAWFAALDNTTKWLWDAAMGPIVAEVLKFHFSTPPRVTLIPVGRLGLLPLHAAWTPDSAKPTGRRYALDDLLITYSPNALALSKAKAIAERVSWDKLMAVDEPKPQPEDAGAGPLPNSEYEVATVCSYFSEQNQLVFRHEQAKCDAVLNALNESTVLHFSCHGSADFLEPLNSGLLMSDGEMLTLKKMLDLRLNGIRLAVLSACEMGIPDFGKLPDETVSLSAGMLQAGIGGVMASLWSVYDSSTMMLMAYFYESWRKQGMSPPEALRQAQIWMRDTTNGEKTAYFKQEFAPDAGMTPLSRSVRKNLLNKVQFKEPEDRNYQGPYHWAAFQYMGV